MPHAPGVCPGPVIVYWLLCSKGIGMFFLKFPILSNTWSRWAGRSHVYTFPSMSTATQTTNTLHASPVSFSARRGSHWRKC